MALAVLPLTASDDTQCRIECLPQGVHVKASGRVRQVFWCCETCHEEAVPLDIIRPVVRGVKGSSVDCNIACRLDNGSVLSKEAHCAEGRESMTDQFLYIAIAVMITIYGLWMIMYGVKKARLWWRRRQRDRRERNQPQEEMELATRGPAIPISGEVITSSKEGGRVDDGFDEVDLHVPPRPSTSKSKGITRSTAMASTLVLVMAMMLYAPFPTSAMQLTGAICAGCSVKCTQSGVAATTHRQVLKSEICCRGSYCHTMSRGGAWEHTLRHELLVNPYHCEGTFWMVNSSVSYTLECPKVDKCELIHCTLCLELLANPSCHTKWTILVYGIMLTMVMWAPLLQPIPVSRVVEECEGSSQGSERSLHRRSPCGKDCPRRHSVCHPTTPGGSTAPGLPDSESPPWKWDS